MGEQRKEKDNRIKEVNINTAPKFTLQPIFS